MFRSILGNYTWTHGDSLSYLISLRGFPLGDRQTGRFDELVLKR